MNLTLRGFMRKEFIQTLRDPRMRVFIFVAPVLQLLIFGYALSTEVRNIRLSSEYQPGDVLARRIEERALASGWFIPAAENAQDPYTRIASGRADAVLIAPAEGLTRSVRKGNAPVQLLIDTTNMIKARSIEYYMRAIIREVLAEGGAPQPLPPVQLDVRVLYNPAMKTSFFLVPGVMVMLLCILTLILTSMALVREKEMGTFETLISAPVKNWEILLGKTLPFFLLGMVLVFIILLAAIVLFGLPMRGAFWKFLLAALVFVCSTISIGTLISTLARNQQQAMMGSFLFLFPSIMLSGMMFPIENMPKALIGVAYLNPLKYMLTLLRNILLKGGDDWVFWSNFGVLLLFAVVVVRIALWRFKQTLN